MGLYQFSMAYIIIACLNAGIGLVIAFEAFSNKRKTGFYFGIVCVSYIVVDLSYLVSVFARNYLMTSVMSSLYFISMSVMMFFFMRFTREHTHYREKAKGLVILKKVFAVYLFVDILVFLINPFYEIAISYIPTDAEIARYIYDMKPLYYAHLVYNYALVVSVIALLVYKTWITPIESGRKYLYASMGVIVMVAINAVFLFVPGSTILNEIDLGILLYGYLIAYMYWSAFHYTAHGMLDQMRSQVFDTIGQGIVLFDFEDRLLLYNEKITQMLPQINWNEDLTTQKMVETVHPRQPLGKDSMDSCSVQTYPKVNGQVKTYRCDYKRIYNKKNKPIGRLFVYSDAELEIDVLTGFHTWGSYHLLVEDNPDLYDSNAVVAVFDLNGLSTINKTLGHAEGDRKIQALANALQHHIPYASYYVRDTEANLFAICNGISQTQLQESIQKMIEEEPDPFQYAIVNSSGEGDAVLRAMDEALNVLRKKKMLDEGATHSSILNTMIHMLQECDMDTEEHVLRTRKLGEELGKRMDLTDSQQSELALLCLLHDIGKIGIPLEILNKPGKLTDDEWRMLQTHVEKGSQIAGNIEELQDIAASVRHHHERWDGKGYPDGLRKESIPLLARMIAVVDAYDAMVHDRVYRKAMTTEQAEDELRRAAGTQFDPYIVSEFLQMLEEHSELKGTAAAREDNGEGNRTQSFVDTADECRIHSSHLVPFSRYILDEDNHFVEVDAFFTGITGYTLADLQANHMNQLDLLPPEDRAEYLLTLEKELAEKDMVYIEHRILRKDGKVMYVFCYGKRYYDSAAKEGRSEILIADCSDTYSVRTVAENEREKAQVRLSFWEDTYRSDPLTGILNRAAFQNDTEQQLLTEDYTVMMLMMDVDNFKQYNDCFGHQEGDELLITAAQNLDAALRKNDIACRMGGDEFAAAFFFPKDCPETTMRERAQQVFDKVTIALQSVQNIASISMGVAISDSQIKTFRQLYECADDALYKSKESGRSRLSFYEGGAVGRRNRIV